MKFSKTHEWVEVVDGVATIGITDYAAKLMGDIVFAELPKIGEKIYKGEVFASIESVKAVSEIFSPISGVVTSINEELYEEPEKISGDAYNTYLIKASVEALEDGLMDKEVYDAKKESFH